MALVVFLKGINVGGHKRFRPSVLAKDLARFDVVNVGTAGTFVVRKPVARTALRSEIERRLPFQTHLMICPGRDILRVASADPFADHPAEPTIIRFLGVMPGRRPARFPLPLELPSEGRWLVRLIAHQDQFVFGLHRREMKAIRYLGQLEDTFGVPVTVRSWTTVLTLANILKA